MTGSNKSKKKFSKLNFVIIGAQKCATTNLASILSFHPDINFSVPKEVHYFSFFLDWKSKIDEYYKNFKKEGEKLLKGEASTSYSMIPEYNHVAKNLYEYNSDLKIIYLIRNPIDRIISNYMHNFTRGRTKLPIDVEIFKKDYYINRSKYGMQIFDYLKYFDRKQIKIITFENYVKDIYSHINEITDFLELRPIDKNFIKLGNKGGSYDTYILKDKYKKLYRLFKVDLFLAFLLWALERKLSIFSLKNTMQNQP